MEAGANNPYDGRPAQDRAEERDDRDRRGPIALIVLVALAVLLVWWLWLQTSVVPDVTGMTEQQARAELEAAGFVTGRIDIDRSSLEVAGHIGDQGIPAGTRALKGEAVDLFVSGASGRDDADSDADAGTAPAGFDSEDDGDSIRDRGDDEYNYDIGSKRYVGVPQVLNQTASSAISELKAAGYRVKVVYEKNTGGIAKGRVFYQTPEPGSSSSAVVEIWVSTGAPPAGSFSRQPNIPAGMNVPPDWGTED